nr:hypothetical protein [Candidatus Microthrix sp.]
MPAPSTTITTPTMATVPHTRWVRVTRSPKKNAAAANTPMGCSAEMVTAMATLVYCSAR